MILDDLRKTTGEWLRGEGPMSDVVLSSRLRLARNLAEQPFLSTASSTERTEIFRRLTEEIASSPFGADALLVDMADTDEIDREVLVERHLISHQHAAGAGSRGVSISPTETQALMINEEDHLRIQVLRSGMQLDELWEEANRIVAALLDAAPRFGYRLPEVFAGYARDEVSEPVELPRSCSPQAWAAGTVPLLVRAMLGVEPWNA